MTELVKICFKCQHENHPQADVCTSCNEDISKVPRTRKQPEAAPVANPTVVASMPGTPITPPPAAAVSATRRVATPTAHLVCEVPGYPAFAIFHNTTVGREIRKPGDVDLSSVPQSDYISRQHATFLLQGNRWFVRAEKTTNGTWLNEVSLPPGQLQEIKPQDKLRLGMTTFTFRE